MSVNRSITEFQQLAATIESAIQPYFNGCDPKWLHNVSLLSIEALRRVVKMKQSELRSFVPSLFCNDGDLANVGNCDLSVIQTMLSCLLPPGNWPRP